MTFGFKFLFLPVWSGGWGYGTYLLFNSPDKLIWFDGGTPPVWGKWLFLGIFAVGSYAFSHCIDLKRVDLDSDGLLVSNYVKTVHIPIAEVSRAGIDASETYEEGASLGFVSFRESRPTCVLELRDKTAFGRVITFIPKSHEAVAVLRARLGPIVGKTLEDPPPPPSEPSEFYGRGTV